MAFPTTTRRPDWNSNSPSNSTANCSLDSNSTELYNGSTPTRSLKSHVWSSSSGNNCHAVHRSLYSGASVYECTMGIFYLVPFHQPISAHAISSPNCHWNVSLPSGASPWMAFWAESKVQNITKLTFYYFINIFFLRIFHNVSWLSFTGVWVTKVFSNLQDTSQYSCRSQ